MNYTELYITDRYLENYHLYARTVVLGMGSPISVNFSANLDSGDYLWACAVTDVFPITTFGDNHSMNLQYSGCGGGGGYDEDETGDGEDGDEWIDYGDDGGTWIDHFIDWWDDTFGFSDEDEITDGEEIGGGGTGETTGEEIGPGVTDDIIDDLEHDDRYSEDIDWSGSDTGSVEIDFEYWPSFWDSDDTGFDDGTTHITITDIVTGDIVFDGEITDGERIYLPYGEYFTMAYKDWNVCFGRIIKIPNTLTLHLALVSWWWILVLLIVIYFIYKKIIKR